jgi:DNA-binding protein Fis
MPESGRVRVVHIIADVDNPHRKTALIFGYHRPTLYRKLKKFGLMASHGKAARDN